MLRIITYTWDDVQAELCDVIFTAMVALTTITPEAPKVFDAHLARVAGRPLQPASPRTGTASPGTSA